MTIGQRLREAREANQMSIGDIARRTYIQPKFIQAIDEDNLSIIPASHCRLFVREYAKIVGVNPDEVLPLLPEYNAPPPAPIQPELRETPKARRQEAAPAPPLPAMPESERKAYSDVMKRLSTGRGIKLGGSNTMIWLVSGAAALLLIAAVYYFFFSGKVSPGSAGDRAGADSSSSPTQILTRADSGDSAAPGTEASASSGDSLTLEGRASGKVWFAIVMDDGRRTESDTLDSGSVRVWRAEKTFKLALANAGQLNLSLNGRSLGTLGPPHTSVRNQIIDSSGIRKPFQNRRSTSTSSGAARRTQRTSPPRIITPTEMRTAPPR